MDGILSSIVVGILSATVPEMGSYMMAPSAAGLTTGHVDLAVASTELFFTKLKQMYMSLYLFEALIGFLSTMSFPIGMPVPAINVISFTLMPFDGLVLLSNAHTVIVEAIGYLMMIIWAKQFILIFARDAIPIILLPLGLVCRAFPFYRTTGSSIIALCIAGYFVFPMAVILSNYMIFDLYKPADFVYSPLNAGYVKSSNVDKNVVDLQTESASHANEVMREIFTSKSLVESGSSTSGCIGNVGQRLLCSTTNVLKGGWNALSGLVSSAYRMWKFMMGFAGDFWSTLFSDDNFLLPTSVTSGLYFFIIEEVVTMGQFVVLVLFTTVIEIIFTVTMYRNISMLIGGEAEIAGITKLV
jgi:hypothetical protein